MPIRVISGEAHGRRLHVPAGTRTRPTSSLVRGAVFDMLEHRGWLAEAVVVDLFAGSGALGIEALSRGARQAIFVESAVPAVRALRRNLAESGLAPRAEVITAPVPRALRTLARREVAAGGVLADPPYRQGWCRRLLDSEALRALVMTGGWVALEHAAAEVLPDLGPFELVGTKRHGETAVSLLARREGDA
jgi:16S rRNA (guanine(966)-N(2))-methyltransferase RsmD